MNQRQLEILHAIMTEGSISDAARSLKISQPAVSKSVRLMEQELGLSLFRRVGGRLFPSSAAETLAPEAARVLGELAEVARLSKELRDGRSGHLIFAALPTLAPWLMPLVLPEFRKRWPKIEVEVQIVPAKQMIPLIARRQIDLGLLFDPAANPLVASEDVCRTEAVFAVPVDHPLAKHSYVCPEDLQQISLLIGYPEDTYLGLNLRRALSAAGIARRYDIVTNSFNFAYDLVSAGIGLALVDPFAIPPDQNRVVGVPFRPSIELQARVLWARERPRSAASIAFLTEIRRAIKLSASIRRFAATLSVSRKKGHS